MAQDIGVATKMSIDIATDDIVGDVIPARDANKYLYITTTYIYIPFRITHSFDSKNLNLHARKPGLELVSPFSARQYK